MSCNFTLNKGYPCGKSENCPIETAYLGFAAYRQTIEDIIDALVELEDPNDIDMQYSIFNAFDLDLALLSEEDREYIVREVVKRL